MRYQELLNKIKEHHYHLIVIDGRCGSGKSTLAKRLANDLKCNLFHMDDFYLPKVKKTRERLSEAGGNVDYERFMEDVLARIDQDFSYQVFDCKSQQLVEWIEVKRNDINIIEGSYALHPSLKSFYDFKIFVECAYDTRLKRIRERNKDNYEDFIKLWIPLEDAYFDGLGIKDQCDAIYQGDYAISIDELKDEKLIDIRNSDSFSYGFIPGAINMPDILTNVERLDQKECYVIYDDHDQKANESALKLNDLGFDVFYLRGGYQSFMKTTLKDVDEKWKKEMQKSISKTFKKELMSPFCKAINQYDMIKPHDRIAVCISGGKDSMLMGRLFLELKRHNKIPFELVFLVMDPGYNELNKQVIINNARKLDLPIEIFNANIFDYVYTQKGSPCYLCARMRRGHLYCKAQELGCNKIALGHHYDDVIETILMSMLYGGQVQTMMPKLKSANFAGMELIRPMYLIREEDIIRWRDHNNLHFIECACRFSDEAYHDKSLSKRKEIKHLIAELKKSNPYVENNIFKSVMNVSLDSIIEYKKDDQRYNFLDEY